MREAIVSATLIAVMLVMLNAISAPAYAADLKLPLLWTAELNVYFECGPTLVDINGDGRDEILVASQEEMIALDGAGKVLWRWRTKARFATYPAVLVRSGQTPLIYGADNSGLLTCLDATGKEVWHTQLKAPAFCTAAAVCALNGDGAPTLIQSDDKGWVSAFDALTGKVLWQREVKGAPSSPAVADINGDGKQEVVVVTGTGALYALKSDSTILWEQGIGGSSPSWHTSAPVIFGASDGSIRIVAASNAGQVFCFDRDGNVLWSQPTKGSVASTISVGDFDQDGRADVFLITQLGVVYRFDESGSVIWDIDMQGRSLAAGAIVDINGDGRLEYVICTQGGLLLVLNEKGEFIFDYQFDNRTINVTPTFGKVAAECPGLSMVISGGESGKMFCFGTPAPADALQQWTQYRGDVRKSGSWFGLTQKEALTMAPANLAWDQILTGQDVRFVISNPKPGEKAFKATAVCVRPDGGRQVATAKILGKTGELLMPIAAIAAGTYRFTWALQDGDGREALAGARDIAIQPFVNDRAIVRRAVEALTASASAVEAVLPLSALALRREVQALNESANTLLSLQDAIPGSNSVSTQQTTEKTADLVKRAKRGLSVASVVRQASALGTGTSLVAFEGSLWENRGVDAQLPVRALNPVTVKRDVVPGEHDPVSLVLFNITDHELVVRVQVQTKEGGPAVKAHRSVPVPTSLGEESWDVLPDLDEASVISIPSLTSRELWLDADLSAVKPGEHEIGIELLALNGAGVLDGPKNPQAVPPPVTKVAVAYTVLPFEMASQGAFRMCCWAKVADSETAADMLEHGNNVFCVPFGEAKCNGQKRLESIDFAKLDTAIAPLQGKDVFLLIQHLPALTSEFGSKAYTSDLKKFLDDTLAHLQAKGFDLEHIGLYPYDEPGGNGWKMVNDLVAFAKLVRAANPKIMIYMDGGGDIPMFEALAPYIDIWCPGIYQLAEKTPLMDIVRRSAKLLWSYNCGYAYARPVGANVKNMNIIADFRTAALFALRHNASGIGFWSYNIGDDPWGRIGLEYTLVYPGRDKPIVSRRWEAVREGIEDYRIGIALREKMEKAGADAQAKIKHLLEVSLPTFIDQSYSEMVQGVSRSAIDLTNSEAAVAALRAEMIECVKAVGGATSKGK